MKRKVYTCSNIEFKRTILSSAMHGGCVDEWQWITDSPAYGAEKWAEVRPRNLLNGAGCMRMGCCARQLEYEMEVAWSSHHFQMHRYPSPIRFVLWFFCYLFLFFLFFFFCFVVMWSSLCNPHYATWVYMIIPCFISLLYNSCSTYGNE